MFTVGFIGLIRYMEQIKLLIEASEIAGCNVIFAGAIMRNDDESDFLSWVQNSTRIKFIGKYNYQQDIAAIYGMMDCIYAVYDADNPNVKIALPNKLYEAIWCGLPLLAAKGTYLGDLVTSLGVGLCVSHKDAKELAKAIIDLKDNLELRNAISSACEQHKNLVQANAYNEKLMEFFRRVNEDMT